MRTTTTILAVAAGLLCAAPAARAQNPSQMLQGLLSGNQGQDQALRDAYERGYRHGREDQVRDDRARFDRDRPPPRGYRDPDQRDPYGR
jgi:hypothetical protein